MQLWTSEVIKPLSEIKIWLTIIIYYYFCNHRWSLLKCCSIFIISFGYLVLTEQFFQGNVPLRRLPNDKTLFMSWRRSAIKEVNDWAQNIILENASLFFLNQTLGSQDAILCIVFFCLIALLISTETIIIYAKAHAWITIILQFCGKIPDGK